MPSVTHTYAVAGDYVVSIRGDFPRFYVNNGADRLKLRSVDQWGDVVWTSMESAFRGCENLAILATDTPNLNNVTNMSYMFYGTVNLTGNFSGWDTSRVTTMSYLFAGATNFNQPLSSWDVSKVTTMQAMFNAATKFDQDISSWDTSSVTVMSSMFNMASSFNQSLSGWDTSKVTTMLMMFLNASAFNQDLSARTMTGVTTAINMLTNTALSTYNYNEILHKRSQQGVKSSVSFGASPTQYGGCEINAFAGIAGRALL